MNTYKSRFNLLRPNCMIDLETLSTYFDAAILSIGATKFDHTGILSTFYTNVRLKSNIHHELHVDPNTLEWWKEQSQDALTSLFRSAISLEDALGSFNEWYGNDSMPTWSKGSDFDLVIMRNAYRAVRQHTGSELKEPWSFRDGLCCRTMIELFHSIPELTPEITGTKHNALDDAVWQSQYIINIWKAWAEQDQDHV